MLRSVTSCVPGVITRDPRQVAGEGGEEVIVGPGQDHVVIQ